MADDDKISKDDNDALSSEEKKRRGQRNLAIALALAAFIALIYAVTIFRLSGSAGG